MTRTDLVRAFARCDAEITKEIGDDVVIRGLRLDMDSVQVEVEDGEGDSHRQARKPCRRPIARGAGEQVPGVIGVHSKLAWTDDDIEC